MLINKDSEGKKTNLAKSQRSLFLSPKIGFILLVIFVSIAAVILIYVVKLNQDSRNHQTIYKGVLKAVQKPPKKQTSKTRNWKPYPPECPERRRPKFSEIFNSTSNWQKVVSEKVEAYIYSAYLDERYLAGSIPWVRVMGIAIGQNEVTVWCHLWVEGIDEPMIVKGLLNPISVEGKPIENTINSIIVSCQLRPNMPLPTHLSLTIASPCSNYSNYLPLVPHDDPGNQSSCEIEFGVCASTNWFEFNDDRFVEWMEFHKLMGVRKISLYTINHILKFPIIDQYVEENFLELQEIDYPDLCVENINYEFLLGIKNFAQNECFYRHVYKYCHLVSLDMDEFIVPRRNMGNFSDLLNVLNKIYYLRPFETSYKFFNTYFYIPSEVIPTVNNPLAKFRILSHFNRTEPVHPKFGSRSIVTTRFCFAFHNFHCVMVLPLYDGEIGTKVSPEEVALHIYRQCDEFLINESCRYKDRFVITDEVMLKYEHNLTKAFNSVTTYESYESDIDNPEDLV